MANPFDSNDETPSWMTEDSTPTPVQSPPPQPYAPPPPGGFGAQPPNAGPPSGGYVPPNEHIRESVGPQIKWQDPAASFVSQQVWNEYGGTTQLEKEIEIPPKIAFAIRAAHLLGAFFVGLAAVLGLIGSPDITEAIVLLYLFGFGIILCMFETPLKAINQILAGNCGFMEHAAGRFVFLLLVGSLCFAYGVWGIIAGVICIGASAMNLYAGIMYQKCCHMEEENSAATSYNNAPFYPPEQHNPMQEQPGQFNNGGDVGSWLQQPNDGIDV